MLSALKNLMRTQNFPGIAGKTIQSAQLQLSDDSHMESDNLELIFTDGSMFTLELSQVMPQISYAIAASPDDDYEPILIERSPVQ